MIPREVPPRQLDALAAIARLTVPRGPSQHELARDMGISQPTAARLMFKLARRGLVEMPPKGRAQLTAAGLAELHERGER